MIHLIGNGGHAQVVRDVIKRSGLEGPVTVEQDHDVFFIAIGDNSTRKAHGEVQRTYIKLIHPSAVIANDVQIDEGSIIMAGAVIQPGVRIGKHVIVNTGATIDHGCIIDDFVHIAPGVHLCGGVVVGEGALMGVGSCAVPKAFIKPWTLVKAGMVAK